jgi:CRISPR-associated protein Cas1
MEQGLTLTVEGERFAVERAGRTVQQVRVSEVEEVLVFGGISLTPAAVATLLRQGIDTVFLTTRGRYRGRLVGRSGRNPELRVRQYEWARDQVRALGVARSIVAGKIANQRALLLRSQREHKREELAAAAAQLRAILRAVEGASGVDVLRGLEGQASAVYFGVFGRCLRNSAFRFEGRTRRPPRDPINAMLSFGYTMLGTVAESAVLRAGLDPMLGVFHAPEYGRSSLALDMVEEFRPVLVDALVLRLVNRREVAPEDFEQPPDEVEAAWEEEETPAAAAPAAGAVWLGETGRRVFFRAWGRRLRETHYHEGRSQTLTFEEILQQQVYHLAQVIRGDALAYRPFVVR